MRVQGARQPNSKPGSALKHSGALIQYPAWDGVNALEAGTSGGLAEHAQDKPRRLNGLYITRLM